MLVGIDDTDSINGMCTTYLAKLILKKLEINEQPYLIRLNPNIPYKTRGNGAIAFEAQDLGETKKEVLKYVKKFSHLSNPKTNPGIAFVPKLNKKKKQILNKFYKKTLSEMVLLEDAEDAAAKVGAQLIKFKNGRGVIGALAACGASFSDKTYELIAYRRVKNFGKKRQVDVDSVFRMDELFFPRCFDSVDYETHTVLITPRGRDPVFCGIRGETASAVEKAWSVLKPLEDIEFTQVFKTNQATDAHIIPKKISDVKQYDCVMLKGVVSSRPEDTQGGHVFFRLRDAFGEISCGAYKPSGSLKKAVSLLLPGDEVAVFGGLGKYARTVNIERLEVKTLGENIACVNPSCCGRRMMSAGKNKGFRCRVCGRKSSQEKIRLPIKRGLTAGFYEPPPRARRHLSKPLTRFK